MSKHILINQYKTYQNKIEKKKREREKKKKNACCIC